MCEIRSIKDTDATAEPGIDRRGFLRIVGASAAAAFWPAGSATAKKDRTRDVLPNILYIMADDMGYGDLGCQNAESKIPTPNLDRLAAQGTRFADAHSPSGVCTPTRYGVLTGRYCWRSRLRRGVLGGKAESLLEPGRTTTAGMLQTAGYRTGAIGKWHLGRRWELRDADGEITEKNIDFTRPLADGPTHHGFDYYFGRAEPAWTFMENTRVLAEPTARLDLTHLDVNLMGPNNNRGIMAPGWTHEQMLPTYTEKVVAFIDAAAKASPRKPFFLYFTPYAPHKPVVPNKEFIGKSKAGLYGDFVCELDHRVGQVLAALDRNGLADNTLVIFTSDNGPENTAYPRARKYGHYSMDGLRGLKRDNWEGGHRVPFIARWPGKIAAGATCDETICLVDMMATFAAVAGVDVPDGAGEDSANILPALLGRSLDEPIREATVHHSCKGRFAIRQGNWVYIDFPTGDDNKEPEWRRQELGVEPHEEPRELFNLADDPTERYNLAAKHPEKIKSLRALLEKYKADGRSVKR